MARYTNLYQSPRSPLIQGRTRWERPLWQAWLVGMLITAVLLVGVLWIRTVGEGAIFTFDAALGWLLGGVAVGSALGAGLANLWGWRMRWLGSSFGGALLGVIVYAIHAVIAAQRVPYGG